MDFESPGLKDWALRFVRRRCPGLSATELEEATQNLLDYMQVVWDIYGRLRAEGVDVRKLVEERQRLYLIGSLISVLKQCAAIMARAERQ